MLFQYDVSCTYQWMLSLGCITGALIGTEQQPLSQHWLTPVPSVAVSLEHLNYQKPVATMYLWNVSSERRGVCQTLHICGQHNWQNKSSVGVGWRVVVIGIGTCNKVGGPTRHTRARTYTRCCAAGLYPHTDEKNWWSHGPPGPPIPMPMVVSVTILVAVTLLVKVSEGVTETRRGGNKWGNDYHSKSIIVYNS